MFYLFHHKSIKAIYSSSFNEDVAELDSTDYTILYYADLLQKT